MSTKLILRYTIHSPKVIASLIIQAHSREEGDLLAQAQFDRYRPRLSIDVKSTAVEDLTHERVLGSVAFDCLTKDTFVGGLDAGH